MATGAVGGVFEFEFVLVVVFDCETMTLEQVST
jgi:hypothetical protein